MTDGVEGQKQAMNLRLMRRLISARATSALAINLLPSPPVDMWHTHQQTHGCKRAQPTPDQRSHARARLRHTAPQPPAWHRLPASFVITAPNSADGRATDCRCNGREATRLQTCSPTWQIVKPAYPRTPMRRYYLTACTVITSLPLLQRRGL